MWKRWLGSRFGQMDTSCVFYLFWSVFKKCSPGWILAWAPGSCHSMSVGRGQQVWWFYSRDISSRWWPCRANPNPSSSRSLRLSATRDLLFLFWHLARQYLIGVCWAADSSQSLLVAASHAPRRWGLGQIHYMIDWRSRALWTSFWCQELLGWHLRSTVLALWSVDCYLSLNAFETSCLSTSKMMFA